MVALCDTLRRAVIETGISEAAGVRVRTVRCDAWSIADGNPRHAFVDMVLRLRAGRALETRKALVAHVFAAAEAKLKPLLDARPLSLSLELRELDPELSPKTGSVRRHLEDA